MVCAAQIAEGSHSRAGIAQSETVTMSGRTNTVYNTETVAHVYKALWTVEDIIRTSKSILETRPIYHKRDETIRGHVFCSFLALLLKQELEGRMKRTDLQWEWNEVIRGLDALQQVEANFQGRRFLFRSQ